jgi:hypothetical protein
MGISATLADTVTGGVHQRAVLKMLGPATYTTMMAMWTEAAMARNMVFLFVA